MMSPITATNSGKAFTLVEMLLVVAIIGTLAAVAVPRYAGSFALMKLHSGAYDVAAVVEYAQSSSILHEKTIRFTVSQDGRECEASLEDGEDGAFRPARCVLPEGVTITKIDFADPMLAGREYVAFRPDGDCDSCNIVVEDRAGRSFQVELAPGTGHARVVRESSDAAPGQ